MSALKSRLFTAILIVILLFQADAVSNDLCEVVLETCPENLNGDTLTVPSSAVALSADVRACEIQKMVEGVTSSSEPPSIMFVIDHSASMMFEDVDRPDHPLDPEGSRYTVTRDVIDTLHRVMPEAEVGIAVFSRYLFLDHRNNSCLQHFPQEDHEHGSYMPLLQLNQEYENGRRGYQILMDLLETREVDYEGPTKSYTLTDLVYEPEFDIPYSTNINCGFNAAKDAFGNTDKPGENQFIIFLSDGEANYPKNNTTGFVEGADVPTTFTIFFSQDGEAPEQITDMSENIRENGFSESNDKTNLWAIQTNHETLLDLLINEVVSGLLDVTSGMPHELSVNNSVSNEFSGDQFVFSKRFPLQTGVTEFDLGISYTMEDSQNGADHDTSTRTVFYVKREENAAVSEGVSISCWKGAVMSVRHEGSIVEMVREDMSQLEIVFDQGENDFSSVQVNISNQKGSVDSEVLNLVKQDDATWTSAFTRKISGTSRVNDRRLQHRSDDSIIVVFRNPDIPLDTVRISLPFNHSADLALYPRAGNPEGQQPLPEQLSVAAGEQVEIFAKVFGQEGVWINQYETVDSLRNRISWSVNDSTNGSIEPISGNRTSFKSTVAHRNFTVSASLPFGEGVITRSVEIGVQPAVPHSLDIQKDSAVTSRNSEDSFKGFWFASDQEAEYVWAVVRDRHGNYVRHAASAQWNSTEPQTAEVTRMSGCHALVSRGFLCSGLDTKVIASEGVLVADTITVGCEGEKMIAAGPNPFVPGVTRLDSKLSPRSLEYYRNVVADAQTGILVSVESPRPLREKSDEALSFAKVTIYDAVGNVVIGDLELKRASSPNSYGFVWDGVNEKGRIVGAGVYLVRISATMEDGSLYMIQKKVGVTR
ncbi:MAG: FlgD immunoglobulin-like domain containing protein [Chitinispirillaceae bacterium]